MNPDVIEIESSAVLVSRRFAPDTNIFCKDHTQFFADPQVNLLNQNVD